jgi:hypothetical protein
LLIVCSLFVAKGALVYGAEEPATESAFMAGEGVSTGGNLLDYQFHDVPGASGPAPAMTDDRQSGRFVVSKTATDTWSVNERLGLFHVSELGPIPGTAETMPVNLWSVNFGGAYSQLLGGGKSWGLNLGMGSDSDELFHSIHETTFRAGANYRLPSREHNAWLFSLNYSNNRHFLNGIPLPGIGYYFEALNRRLQGLVGFPFLALRYRPTDDWAARLSLFGPRNLNVEISRRVVGALHAYTAFIWGSQEWELANRLDTSNRLFFDRKKVALGLRSPLPYGLALDVSGGREFDRRFFENDSSSYSSVPTIGLAPAWYGETRISWRFGAGSSERS